jgi:hypothetical protein
MVNAEGSTATLAITCFCHGSRELPEEGQNGRRKKMGRRKKRFKRILGRKSKGKNTHFQTAQNTPLSVRR